MNLEKWATLKGFKRDSENPNWWLIEGTKRIAVGRSIFEMEDKLQAKVLLLIALKRSKS